tara:strand:- start:5987 stop:6949 length:963 start_codon:yes stop_codon:yes gene_type:complete
MAKSQKKHHKKGSQRHKKSSRHHKKSSLHKNKKIGSQKTVHKKGLQHKDHTRKLAGMYRPHFTKDVEQLVDKIGEKKGSKVLARRVGEFLREPEPRRYAKVHVLDNTEIEKLGDSDLRKVIKDVRYGDLIENTDKSGYRTSGISVVGFSSDKKKLELQSLDYNIDNYGLVGEGFSLGPNYPVGYWSGALEAHARAEIERTGNKFYEGAYWNKFYEGEVYEPIHREIIKRIKESDLKEDDSGYNDTSVTFNWGPATAKPSTLIFEGSKKDVMRTIDQMLFSDDDGDKLVWTPTGSYAYFRTNIGPNDNYAIYVPHDELPPN